MLGRLNAEIGTLQQSHTYNLMVELGSDTIMSMNSLSPISINGHIDNPNAFHWLHDSGFRYGYGCFETIRLIENHAPLFDHHQRRLIQSLRDFSIEYDATGLYDRILRLSAYHNHPDICHVHVTGGSLPLSSNRW